MLLGALFGSDHDPNTHYPALVGANRLHDLGITGRGVTVAVLDSGLVQYDGLYNNASGQKRLLGHYDAIADNDLEGKVVKTDYNGHGGHVASVAFAHCPFGDVAAEHPELVCALHRGMVEGLVERCGDSTVTEFNTFADRPACRAVLSGR